MEGVGIGKFVGFESSSECNGGWVEEGVLTCLVEAPVDNFWNKKDWFLSKHQLPNMYRDLKVMRTDLHWLEWGERWVERPTQVKIPVTLLNLGQVETWFQLMIV